MDPFGATFFDVDADAADPTATAAQELAYARQHFFLPRSSPTPSTNSSTVVDYDAPRPARRSAPRDALGNTVDWRRNDYRVLQPRLVTDPNRNRTDVAFDALGMVVARR